MKVSLKPLFGNDFDEIELTGLLLPIGMGDAPFDSYPDDLRLQLAQRHARLFLDEQTLFVVDLHSPTGTTVNGQPVTDDPMAVAPGDVLCFGHDLCFEAVLQATEASAEGESPIADEEGERTQVLAAPAPPILLLLPEKAGQGLSPVAISTFPFLVSKSSGYFAGYKQQFAAESSFVSRRHAHIYSRGQDLVVEDLGSTNGTFHNGKRLDGSAEILQAGDTLQFGHDLFTFKVALEAAPEPSNPASATERAVPEGTILVSRAASFLDIYCDTPEPESPAQEESVASVSQAPLDRIKTNAVALRDNAMGIWQQAPLSKEVRLGLLALLAAALLAVLATLLLADNRPEEVQALLDAQDYEPALMLAEGYLVDNPGDASVQRLANQALRGVLAPSWSRAILAGDYQTADKLLATAQQQAPSQLDTPVLALIEWTGNLQRYVSSRERASGIALTEGQHPINALLRKWNENSDRNMRLLDELAREHPAFDPVRVDALSHLRALKSDASVLLEAMSKLRKQVLRPLDAQTGAAALLALDGFTRDFPRVSGADRWRQDVQAYLQLQRAHAAGKLTDYLSKREEVNFNTDYFSARLDADFPGGDELTALAGQYALADQQWRNGELTASLALLDILAKGEWGAEAKAVLDDRQQLLNDFLRLPDLYQTEGYQNALLSFYTRIDAQRDAFMFDALRTDFADQREFAEQRAQELLTVSESAWQDYQREGGISGALRLESKISTRYSDQAKRLVDAHDSMREAAQIYALLATEPLPETAALLYASVAAEADRQRSAIKDLGAVLGAETVAAKSALLPASQEEQGK